MKVLLVFSLGLKKGAGASGQARLLLISAPAGSYRWALRILGSFLLVASAFQSIAAYGLGVGLVTFFSHACFAAWCVSLFLTWRRSLS